MFQGSQNKGITGLGSTNPSVRIEHVCRRPPKLLGSVDGVGVHADRGSCRDTITAELILNNILSYGDRAGWDVSEALAAYVVEVR